VPRFYGQNKKRIDPRYFLNESVEREELIDEIREASKAIAGSRDTYGDIDKLVDLDVEELKNLLKSLSIENPSISDPFRQYSSGHHGISSSGWENVPPYRGHGSNKE
tara:strand:- start:81 stop:401 length:321 start_codon:yes stop_codon:yes gene_type:complete